MATTAAALTALSPSLPGGDLEDSNISSPLSEVDDKDANDEDIEHMHLDVDDDGDNSSLSGEEAPETHNDASDSDSALSDAGSDVNSDANDTEAETLRLYDTPKNQRHRDVVVDQFNQGQIFEHTPTKMRKTPPEGEEDLITDDDASDASSQADGDESPLKPATTQHTSVDEDMKRASQERKRKRSSPADQSDLEQPLRKRTASVAAAEDEIDGEVAVVEDDTTSANLQSGAQSAGEDEEEDSPLNLDTVLDDEVPERETRATKKASRKGPKRNGATSEDTENDTGAEADGQRDTSLEGDVEQPDEDMDADADVEEEAEAEAAARNIEESRSTLLRNLSDLGHANLTEVERKQAAFRDWTLIEEMFGIFRNRLV